MKVSPWACLGVLALLAPTPLPALPELRPLDEAVQQPDFFSFRAQLQAAVARRDTTAVIAALDPGVRLSFGAHGGLDDFRRMWLGPEKIDDLWREMGTLLALGGTFQSPTSFAAPYVFSAWPSQGADAFEHVAVIGSSVRVRAEPRPDAPVLGRLSYSVVRLAPRKAAADAAAAEWVEVVMESGKRGYIAAAYVRSPIGYRILFRKAESGWKVDSFVAGD